MSRPLAIGIVWLVGSSLVPSLLRADEAAPAPRPAATRPGRFFPVVEPITNDTLVQLRATTRDLVEQAATRKGAVRPIIIFEFRPGESAPGTSEFGACYDLANFIATKLEGAEATVAYVPEPLTGYAVLAALACDEVVMGPEAALGPITPEGSAVDPALRDPVRVLALRKRQQPPELFLGMLDREADLRAVRTADRQLHYVFADQLSEFQKAHQVIEDKPAWDGGRRGVLTARRARDEGLSKLTANGPAEVAAVYRLAGQATTNDPTLGQVLRPVWVQIVGPIDTVKKSYLGRRIEQARQEGANLIFFQFNSPGGTDRAADASADLIAKVKDMKTVAFIDDRATGVSALMALACNDIVFRGPGRLGGVKELVVGRNRDDVMPLGPALVESLAARAVNLAEQKGHPAAVARALVDPEAEVVEATDARTGGSCFVLRSQVEAEPARYLNPRVRKIKGDALTVTGDDATKFGLGRMVASEEELKALYGLRGKVIPIDGPTWVDSLVTVLTEPVVSWLLLFVGLFMLVLELKMPGIGLPAIVSALAFLLFFWSHWLSGTADQLEIILFLVGLVCLALELFVFPGFGVFGMSGILLVLASIVMASHTFVWPTREYEYRELGFTLLNVTLAMAAVGVGAVVFARYFPSLPLFNRLILKAEPWTGADDPQVKPTSEGHDTFAYLIGETGRTTSMLRPTGKARFGDLLIDVTADSFFIDPDSLVEVVDVQGTRVIVKRLGT